MIHTMCVDLITKKICLNRTWAKYCTNSSTRLGKIASVRGKNVEFRPVLYLLMICAISLYINCSRVFDLTSTDCGVPTCTREHIWISLIFSFLRMNYYALKIAKLALSLPFWLSLKTTICFRFSFVHDHTSTEIDVRYTWCTRIGCTHEHLQFSYF